MDKPAYDRLRLYGLADADYRAMLAEQGGGCAVCGRTERLVVDHDHATGAVRAILCSGCNSALGHAGDDIERLHMLANYLEVHAARCRTAPRRDEGAA